MCILYGHKYTCIYIYIYSLMSLAPSVSLYIHICVPLSYYICIYTYIYIYVFMYDIFAVKLQTKITKTLDIQPGSYVCSCFVVVVGLKLSRVECGGCASQCYNATGCPGGKMIDRLHSGMRKMCQGLLVWGTSICMTIGASSIPSISGHIILHSTLQNHFRLSEPPANIGTQWSQLCTARSSS